MLFFVAAFFPQRSTIRQKLLPTLHLENLFIQLTVFFKGLRSKEKRVRIEDFVWQVEANVGCGKVDDDPEHKAQNNRPTRGKIEDPHTLSFPAIRRPFHLTGKPKILVISEMMKIDKKPMMRTGKKRIGRMWKRPIFFANTKRTTTQSG